MYLIKDSCIFTLKEAEVKSNDKTQEKWLYFEGIFSASDSKNRNGRVYPKSIWENNLKEKSIFKERLDGKEVLGELEHPADGQTNLSRVSHQFLDAKLQEDGNVWAAGRVLNTPNGRILSELFAAGYPVKASSRGQGTSEKDEDEKVEVVKDDYELETWDFVYKPSVYEVETKTMSSDRAKELESIDATPVSIYESYGCGNGDNTCVLKAMKEEELAEGSDTLKVANILKRNELIKDANKAKDLKAFVTALKIPVMKQVDLSKIDYKELADEIKESIEEAKLWDLYVTKNGKKSKVNKKPMSKKELEDMMADYEKSGISYDSLDSEIVEHEEFCLECEIKSIKEASNYEDAQKIYFEAISKLDNDKDSDLVKKLFDVLRHNFTEVKENIMDEKTKDYTVNAAALIKEFQETAINLKNRAEKAEAEIDKLKVEKETESYRSLEEEHKTLQKKYNTLVSLSEGWVDTLGKYAEEDAPYKYEDLEKRYKLAVEIGDELFSKLEAKKKKKEADDEEDPDKDDDDKDKDKVAEKKKKEADDDDDDDDDDEVAEKKKKKESKKKEADDEEDPDKKDKEKETEKKKEGKKESEKPVKDEDKRKFSEGMAPANRNTGSIAGMFKTYDSRVRSK